MKYVRRELGEAAEASSGGGNKGTLLELGKLVFYALLVLIGIWFGFGLLGELAVRSITPGKEAELLAALAPELELWQPEDEQDLARAELAKHVFERLQALPEVPQLKYRILFLDEEEPNAFALPGETIGLTRGLLDALGDEEVAYAFVLGHELGHFKNRDHLRGLVRDSGAMAAAGLVFGSGGVSPLTGSIGSLIELRYSRDQEFAADDFGITLVSQLYPSTVGSERLFERLTEDGEPPSWAYMFYTHPDTKKRIQRLKNAQPPRE